MSNYFLYVNVRIISLRSVLHVSKNTKLLVWLIDRHYFYWTWKHRRHIQHTLQVSMSKKCPNTEFFLACIFLYLDWICTRYNSKFGHFSHSVCWYWLSTKMYCTKTTSMTTRVVHFQQFLFCLLVFFVLPDNFNVSR